MKPFADSHACRSGAHCGPCRDLEGGRSWRVELGKGFALPAGEPDFKCPHGKEWGAKSTARVGGNTPLETWATVGPLLWDELHRWALTADLSDVGPWLAAFEAKLGCPSGQCRKHWREWVAANPPDTSDLFAWTVAAHNAVNARLDKPIVSLDQARLRYGQ